MSIRIMTRVWDEGPKDRTETMVLLALADHANENGYCWPGIKLLCKKCRLSRQGLLNVIDRLEDKEWITKHTGGGRGNPNRYTIRLDRFEKGQAGSVKGQAGSVKGQAGSVKGQADKDKGSSWLDGNHKGTTNEPSRNTRQADSTESPPSANADEEEEWERKHDPDHWYTQFARQALGYLEKHEMLSSITRNKIKRDGREVYIDEGADEIRKLHKLDDHSKDDIGRGLNALFNESSGKWWRDNNAIASVMSLRSKTSSKDKTKFEAILAQADPKPDAEADGRPGEKDPSKLRGKERTAYLTKIAQEYEQQMAESRQRKQQRQLDNGGA